MAVQPLYAPISDHLGRKIPYLVASSLFAIGIILSASASTWIGLVAARAFCGLGVGGIATMGMGKSSMAQPRDLHANTLSTVSNAQ